MWRPGHRLRKGWFDLPLRAKGVIVVSIPLICILFSVVSTVVFQRQRARLTDWIARAFQAGTAIQRVSALLVDAEVAARGYLLTKDERELAILKRSETNLAPTVARIERYVGDLPEQRAHLERVKVLARARLAALRSLASGGKTEGFTALLGENQKLADEVERELRGMREVESRLWAERIAADIRLRDRLSKLTYGSAVVSLAAGSFAMGLFLTGIARRAQTLQQNAGRLAQGEPVLPVDGRDEIGEAGAALARAAEILAERERQLRALNEELEDRVRERSAALEREVAERRQSEEQLRQAQKMEAIGRLAGGIAHDFNNMLTVVMGFGQSLADRVASDPAATEDVEEILRAAEHSAGLTRQLLAFSRRQVVQPKLLNLNDVVLRTEKLLRRVLGADVEFATMCLPMEEPIRIDEGQLEQVIMNLAVNARDAMPDGGRLLLQTDVVEFDQAYSYAHLETPPGRYVMLAAHDTGHGMTADVRSRIFEPFFTTKGPAKGTGLGLSTVYGIVQQCGGGIYVYSEPGEGSVFKIYFPVADGRPAAAKAAGVESVAPRPATILLVEDDPIVRRMVKQILTQCAHTVLEADSARQAGMVCQEHNGPIDLLLTDMVMPGSNGVELARHLTARYPGLRVLFMSGYASEFLGTKPVLDPDDAFIEKPFTPAALTRKICDLIARRGPMAATAQRPLIVEDDLRDR